MGTDGGQAGDRGGQAGDRRGYLQGFETLQERLRPVVFVFCCVLVGVGVVSWLKLSMTLVLGHVL